MNNPRNRNGNFRRKVRLLFRKERRVCALCGRPIHYEEPSSPQYPLSLVVDEIKPISRWREFGYDSPRAAAEDMDNLQAAHYICNQIKSNHVGPMRIRPIVNVSDGEW